MPPVWSSNHAYLNAPASQTTALTHLGAREYDPVLGRFLSVDAVLTPLNPQQNNGYSYSANSPVTHSDPSGNCYQTSKGNYTGKGCGSSSNGGGKKGPKKPPSVAPPSAGSSDGSWVGSYGPTLAAPAPSSEIQWWAPTTWNGEIWQNVGAAALGIAVGIGVTALVLAAGACTVVTFGVCGVATIAVVGALAAGGAVGGLVTYSVSTGEKTSEGRFNSVVAGGAGGAIAGVGGVIVSNLIGKFVGTVTSKGGGETAGAATSGVPAVTPNDWAQLNGMLRSAAAGKGNFGLGAATAEQTQALGQAWVGPSASWSSSGKAMVSQDLLRQWRSPTWKPNMSMYQSNLEWRNEPRGPWQGNGHIDVLEGP